MKEFHADLIMEGFYSSGEPITVGDTVASYKGEAMVVFIGGSPAVSGWLAVLVRAHDLRTRSHNGYGMHGYDIETFPEPAREAMRLRECWFFQPNDLRLIRRARIQLELFEHEAK